MQTQGTKAVYKKDLHGAFLADWWNLRIDPTLDEKINELRLAGVLSNNAVLQRNQPLPIWGTAQPNSTVTVKFSGQVKQGKVGPLGKWKIILDPLKANSTPQSLLVQTSESNELSIENILIGDVWLCSGQSNMAFTLAISARKVPAIQQRLSEANNSLLRLATKSKANYNTNPSNDECQWKVTTPESSKNFLLWAISLGNNCNPN